MEQYGAFIERPVLELLDADQDTQFEVVTDANLGTNADSIIKREEKLQSAQDGS